MKSIHSLAGGVWADDDAVSGWLCDPLSDVVIGSTKYYRTKPTRIRCSNVVMTVVGGN